jgi:hypothetical protein
VITTHALLARKVQRKLSNGVAALPPADHLLNERDRGQFVPSRRRRMRANVGADLGAPQHRMDCTVGADPLLLGRSARRSTTGIASITCFNISRLGDQLRRPILLLARGNKTIARSALGAAKHRQSTHPAVCLRGRWSIAEMAGIATILCLSRDDQAATNPAIAYALGAGEIGRGDSACCTASLLVKSQALVVGEYSEGPLGNIAH